MSTNDSDFPSVLLRQPPKSHRGWKILIGIVIVLIVAVVVASHINLNYYAISPGTAQPVDPLITVPPGHGHVVHGHILLTDVDLSQVSLLDWIPDKLSSNTQLVPSGELLDPATTPAELTTQGYLEMAQSQSYAKTAALTHLGYKVPETDAGSLLFAVAPNSPAGRAGLQVAQIIKAIDGKPTPNECALAGVLHGLTPGHVAQVSVEQSTVTPNAVIVPGPVVVKPVTLGTPPKDIGPSDCPGLTGPPPVYMGVEVQTQQDYDYPIKISIDTADIGGPSAGLAMTLGIMDKLTSGRLTGGHTVAATGTIDPLGNVGPVGGVPQKTVAVEQGGASVFFVPKAEYHDALSKATPSLHIYPVTSLDQALKVLEHLGGHLTVPKSAGAPAAA